MAKMIYKKITVGCRVTHEFTDKKVYMGVVVQRSKQHVDVIFDDGDEETELDVREVNRIPQRMEEHCHAGVEPPACLHAQGLASRLRQP